jgi:5'-3' exonuclease
MKNYGVLDFSQIGYSSFFGMISASPEVKSEEEKMNMHKYFMLNTIRRLVKDFELDYLFIANDSHSWRKDVFPYYKALRKPKSTDDRFSIEDLHNSLDELQQALNDYFPYNIVKEYGFEADDIIACITAKYSADNRVFIFSGDKDFKQLLRFPNVTLYNPSKNEYIICDRPKQFLFEQILTGDKIDGIPNFLSDDDTFVSVGKRQTALTKKRIEEYLLNEDKFFKLLEKDERLKANFYRNYNLIYLPNENLMKIFYEEERLAPTCPLNQIKTLNDWIDGMNKYFKSLNINAFKGKEMEFIPQAFYSDNPKKN